MVKEKGLMGVHLQYIKWGDEPVNLSGVDGGEKTVSIEDIKDLGFESVTHYQFVHFADVNKSYDSLFDDIVAE